MFVKDFMTKNVMTCKATQTVSDAAKIMLENGFSVMPIVDDNNKLVGIVTESDFVGKEIEIPHAVVSLKRVLGENHYRGDIEAIYGRAKTRELSEVMSSRPVTLSVEASLGDAVKIMAARNLKRLPVVDGEKIVGMVTRKDLIRAFDSIEIY